MESMTFPAMGTDIQVLLDTDEESAWLAFLEVPVWFEQWEQHLSRFRPDSELSYVNTHPEKLIHVSEIFAEVMNLAIQVEQRSHGLITPAILPALINAGYDRSFELLVENEIRGVEVPLAFPISTQNVVWNKDTREICVPHGLQLDFGGVAKGWAAHQAAQKLSVNGPVLVNAGGDIASAGTQVDSFESDQSAWQIGVRNPFERDIDFAVLDMYHGGMATSGIDHRHWQHNGVFRHHLIDPRNGLPAESDLVQVTVLADDVMQAEMVTKMVFFKGSREGMRWLQNHPEYQALLIDREGNMLQTEQLTLKVYEDLMI
jgi:thiamine biosynthesis lipoprotein